MSILDWFRPPVIIEGDAAQGQGLTPYRAHCPAGDWTSHRWWSDPRVAHEEAAGHVLTTHYRPSGRSRADSSDDGWHDGFWY